jgi:hypothetical protein
MGTRENQLEAPAQNPPTKNNGQAVTQARKKAKSKVRVKRSHFQWVHDCIFEKKLMGIPRVTLGYPRPTRTRTPQTLPSVLGVGVSRVGVWGFMGSTRYDLLII